MLIISICEVMASFVKINKQIRCSFFPPLLGKAHKGTYFFLRNAQILSLNLEPEVIHTNWWYEIFLNWCSSMSASSYYVHIFQLKIYRFRTFLSYKRQFFLSHCSINTLIGILVHFEQAIFLIYSIIQHKWLHRQG